MDTISEPDSVSELERGFGCGFVSVLLANVPYTGDAHIFGSSARDDKRILYENAICRREYAHGADAAIYGAAD